MNRIYWAMFLAALSAANMAAITKFHYGQEIGWYIAPYTIDALCVFASLWFLGASLADRMWKKWEGKNES